MTGAVVRRSSRTWVEAPGIETVAPAAIPLPSARVASLSPPDTYATTTADERDRAPLDAREPAFDALELRRIGQRVEALH